MTTIRRLYRILWAGILFFGMPLTASAQEVDTVSIEEIADTVEADTVYAATFELDKRIADYFRNIPDDLLPTLSDNNRLDMLDFMAVDMDAVVTNQLGGKSEMTSLTDSTLTIRMSGALQVDILLLKVEEPVDEDSIAICMIETFGSDSLSLESRVSYFTSSWRLLHQPPRLPVSYLNTISAKKMSTILKRDEEILKKT